MDAHEREAAGAAAGMSEVYGYRPRVGDRVRCERPWSGHWASGTVVATNGVYVLVDVPTEAGVDERLSYYPHELHYVGPGN